MSLFDHGEYRDPRGRTPVSPLLFTQPGTRILATSGQSMLANSGDFPAYHPWTGGVFELSLWDGLIYPCDGNGPAMNMDVYMPGRLSVLDYDCDMLVAHGKCLRILRVPTNIGGTSALDWCPIGNLHHRAIFALDLLASLGLAPTEWVHMLGQADCALGTSARQFADLTKWYIQALRDHGYLAPFIIGGGAYFEYCDPAKQAAVVEGQLIAAAESGNSFGPNDDEWPASMRVDGVHPKDAMRYWRMQRWLHCFGVTP